MMKAGPSVTERGRGRQGQASWTAVELEEVAARLSGVLSAHSSASQPTEESMAPRKAPLSVSLAESSPWEMDVALARPSGHCLVDCSENSNWGPWPATLWSWRSQRAFPPALL